MIPAAGCRIGRVRLKSGAEVRVLEGTTGGTPEVVDKLLDILTRARRGEVVAIAMVTVNPRGTVSTGWEMGDGPYFHHLTSGASILQARMSGK